VSVIRGAALLVALLALQSGLNRIWPAAPRFVDLLLLPPVWYAIARSQRSAMIVGCAGGLLADGWFRADAFGLNGFKKTLIGWLVGALGTRFELNGAPARLLAGIAAALIDSALEVVLRRLLDLHSSEADVGGALVRAAVTGILVIWGFALSERVRRSRFASRWN
jgi:rod shape-determining protein MreD